MGRIKPVQPVKLFIGMLSSSPSLLNEIIPYLEREFGHHDFLTELWSFDFTDYYNREMGTPLWREFVSFEELISPENIKEIKIWTNSLEKRTSSWYASPIRPINLDPGYISLSKVVLGTTKDYTHRIYLGSGIYAEVTLCYRNRQFEAFDWTYPDYKTRHYLVFFQKIRLSYRNRLELIE